MRALTFRQRTTTVAATLSLAVAGALTATAPPAAAVTGVSVSVDAAQQLAVIPNTGVGVNEAVYDPDMNGSAIPGLLSGAGMGAVRYPGGSYADGYHWQTNTEQGGGYVAPNSGFNTGWDLGFNFAGDTGITNTWSATVSQSGPSVNAANVSYNAAIAPGGSVQWGFQATWSSSDADPPAFWLNGAACAIG